MSTTLSVLAFHPINGILPSLWRSFCKKIAQYLEQGRVEKDKGSYPNISPTIIIIFFLKKMI